MNYNWQQADWPEFTFDTGEIDDTLFAFAGGMNAGKYMSIAKTSKATATRDLQHLVEIKALIPKGGGRSVSYDINPGNNALGLEQTDKI